MHLEDARMYTHVEVVHQVGSPYSPAPINTAEKLLRRIPYPCESRSMRRGRPRLLLIVVVGFAIAAWARVRLVTRTVNVISALPELPRRDSHIQGAHPRMTHASRCRVHWRAMGPGHPQAAPIALSDCCRSCEEQTIDKGVNPGPRRCVTLACGPPLGAQARASRMAPVSVVRRAPASQMTGPP